MSQSTNPEHVARQSRPATPPMTKHHGAKVPPGREFRPQPIKAEPKEKPALSQNARIVLSQLDHNGPQTGVELSKATGMSQGSVSTALKALREAGEVTTKDAKLAGGATVGKINTSVNWQIEHDKAEVRRKQAERFDEERADAVGRNGAVGYPDTENDLEDDEGLPPAATTRRIRDDGVGPQTGAEYKAMFNGSAHEAASNAPEKPEGSGASECVSSTLPVKGQAELARKFLSLAGMNIDRLEHAANASIQPLPTNDYRVEAMRRLEPLVSDDIGAAIRSLVEHVTGSEAA